MFIGLINNWRKKEVDRVKIEISFLTLTIFLFIFRTAIPLFKYPFILLYFSLFVYLNIRYSRKIYIYISIFIRKNIIILFVTLVFIISFLFTDKLYLTICKDLVNIVVLLTGFYFYYLIIINEEQFLFFLNKLIQLSIIFAFLISLERLFSYGSSNDIVQIDYNFALIPIFFGMVGIFYNLFYIESRPLKVLNNLILVVFTITILISSSRRGMFVFFIIMFVLIISQISTLNRKNIIFKKICFASRYYLGSLLLIVLLAIIFVIQPYNIKYKTLQFIGVKNVIHTKNMITTLTYRYLSILNKDLSYKVLSDKLWSYKFDPNDPRSGWGSRIHKVIYPLKGRDVKMVPLNTRGYLMDSTCNADTWSGNAYSYSAIGNEMVDSGNILFASVYCFVSEDFNGDWVRISSEGSTKGATVHFYDLNNKGCWQKLDIRVQCNKGRAPVYLYFCKLGVTDFSTLNGYVIFAYPTYEIIHKKKSIESDSVYSFTTFQELKLNHKKHSVNKNNYQKASILDIPYKVPFAILLQKAEDSDPIRNWIKNVFNEDTAYYGYSADISFPYDPKDAIQGRTDRWKFAWEIFTKEYNWKHKIFGNGFDYLNWYGYYFYNDKTKTDWPHNPFLSVLLYSGIFGLSLYLILLYKVISIYIRYVKEYYILFIFWGITFFFSFFSANSPFNPPVMGFFMMLPFFIDYIHKKDNSDKFAVQSKKN